MYRIYRKHMLRSVPVLFVVIILLAACNEESVEDFPEQSFDVTIPFEPGGGSDVLSRSLEPYFEDEFGEGMNFEYQSGAGGVIGMEGFSGSASDDGYSLIAYNSPHIINNPVAGNAQFQLEDFELIGQVAVDYVALVVPDDSPYETLEDYIEDAENNPDEVDINLTTPLEPPHITYVEFMEETGLDIPSVFHEGGGGEQLSALLGGHVSAGIGAVSTLDSELQSGNLRALAVAAPERLEEYPEAPTFEEEGYEIENFTGRLWLTQEGVDEEILQRLEEGLENITNSDDFQEEMINLGYEAEWTGRQELEEELIEFRENEAEQLVESMEADLDD